MPPSLSVRFHIASSSPTSSPTSLSPLGTLFNQLKSGRTCSRPYQSFVAMFSALLKDTSKRKRALKIRRQKADAQPKHKLERLGSRNRPIDRSPSSRTDERVLNAGEHKRSKVEKSQFRSRSSTFDQDSEDSEDSERTVPVTSKRLRVNPSSPKSNRTVRALDAFRKNLPELYHIVHAITIPSLDRSTKYEPCFPGPLNDSDVEVQYPSCSPRERFVGEISSSSAFLT